MTIAEVRLWGSRIGAVTQEDSAAAAVFEYEPSFVNSNIQVSPIVMPLASQLYTFPSLAFESFRGLPGLLADSLPDRFGNTLIDAWLASQGRAAESFNAVERLCYVGTRGMGALEFRPVLGPRQAHSAQLQVDALVELASEALSQRKQFEASLQEHHRGHAVTDLLLVGTSAGGARAKAIIAYNPATGTVRSGQVVAPPGFEYWLLKFDGVRGNKDKELEDPKGFCAIEYAYSLMAQKAGINMTECLLLTEGSRRHFMTKRFDRLDNGDKLHVQSLAALAHFDYNDARAYSYEQAFAVMHKLGLTASEVEQQFRRMAFNVMARNQDDHVKNIAFLMDREGHWSLAPAFDVTYAYNPTGVWTRQHQMTINGKAEGFALGDLYACAKVALLPRGRADQIVADVQAAMDNWRTFATKAQVAPDQMSQIESALLRDFLMRSAASRQA